MAPFLDLKSCASRLAYFKTQGVPNISSLDICFLTAPRLAFMKFVLSKVYVVASVPMQGRSFHILCTIKLGSVQALWLATV